MGILGLVIQRTNGIPIVSKTWTKSLSSFGRVDPMLTAGFMSAITSFADSFDQNIDYIQLSPKNDPTSNGISAVLSYFDEVMMICFCEPYLFLDKVLMKLQWLYNNLIEKKLQRLTGGNVFTLNKEEEAYIERILFDFLAKNLIEAKKEEIRGALEEIERYFYQEGIRGLSINSFDNSILYTYNIEKPELENLLCNMGKGGGVKDWEMQYKPVWTDIEPILVSYTNSAVKFPIDKIWEIDTTQNEDNMQLYYGEVPLYYYIITDTDCSIGPIMEKLNHTLHPILVD